MKRTSATTKAPSRFRFVGELVAELKKVTWPTRQETIRLTIIVLLICAAIALILGAVDYGFTHLVTGVLLKGK